MTWKPEIDKFLSDVTPSDNSITVLAGAGLSRASGIKTFRDPDGWWNKVSPMELASPEGFSRDPNLVWSWYCHRIAASFATEPNQAHYALAKLEEFSKLKLLITQNVDGLHRRAGLTKFLEIHGTLLSMSCTSCQYQVQLTSSPCEEFPDGLPRCECGSLFRPDVVWFGENLPENALDRSIEAIQSSELLIVAGTSGVVYPVAALPHIAFRNNIPIIELNIETTALSKMATIAPRGPVEETLPYLVERLVGAN